MPAPIAALPAEGRPVRPPSVRRAPRTVRRDIDRATAAGWTLTQIEQGILRGLRLSHESRDALWLYAWSVTWRRDRRARGRL